MPEGERLLIGIVIIAVTIAFVIAININIRNALHHRRQKQINKRMNHDRYR